MTSAAPARPTDLRRRATRGTVVNAAFLIAFSGLALLRGLVVAPFLSVADYGVWGLLITALIALAALAAVGIDDRYVQQDEADQVLAFQRAFTLQLALSAITLVGICLALPLFALAYGSSEILLPGYVLALAFPAVALQAPQWAFYRRMDYLRQRRLQAWDPVVGLVVTVALAVAGAGYWALVIGTVAGAWSAAAAALRASPYPIRLRWSGGAVRDYWSFSAPLAATALSGVLVGLVPVLVAQRTLGTAAVGVLAIASTISAYGNRVDQIVTDTLYPAICAIRDRADLLAEAFAKSNRLALLWATPLGVGLAVFAPDLVEPLLGEQWAPATFVLQAFGLSAALNQVGFNWTAFHRALGDTRPIAVVSLITLGAVLAIAVPLLVVEGVDGFGIGMLAAIAVSVVARLAYLRRLFPLGGVLANAARGAGPTLPALVAVLAVRALGGAPVVAELLLYAALALAVSLLAERPLLRELRGYLRPA